MSDCHLKHGVCVHCGWQWSGDPAVRRNCPRQQVQRTEPRSQAQPVEPRSQAQQDALAAICRGNVCGSYDAVIDACRRCGCSSERHERWLSRLRLGDCPKHLWPQP